jgi:hypothetical protein
MSSLGNTYSALGQQEKAIQLNQQLLDFCERALPENHPETGLPWVTLLWRDFTLLLQARS